MAKLGLRWQCHPSRNFPDKCHSDFLGDFYGCGLVSSARGVGKRNSEAPPAGIRVSRFCHNLEVPRLLRNPNREPEATRTRAGNDGKGFAPRSVTFAGFMRVGACSDFVTACGI